MSISTQHFINQFNFDVLLRNCLEPPIKKPDFEPVFRLILILSLVTGLKMKFIMTLRWGDILFLDSINEILVKDELKVRKYFIPIHPVIKSKILELYSYLIYPEFESLISCHPSYGILNSDSRGVRNIIDFGFTRLDFIQYSRESFYELNHENFTQVLFGRKVFEVNGYTNEICKKLKQHFEFRLNKELFDFLEYSSKEEIKYKINLNSKVLIVKLEDKNFNNNYPFQKFTEFSKFLFSRNFYRNSPITDSILILLLLSLYNGIRPSTLIRLKWQDLIQFNESKNRIEVNDYAFIDKHIIHINKEIAKILLNHYNRNNKIEADDLYPTSLNKYHYKDKTLPKLTDSVFIMNNDNPITQPSLSREIKKVLYEQKFRHASEITSKSTMIMYGRRIIEIKGDHKITIKKLIEHFNFRSKRQLFKFLHIDYNQRNDSYSFKGKVRKNIFEEILYEF